MVNVGVRKSSSRKERKGVVVSKSGEKTIVVLVGRRERHRQYGKVISKSKRFHVHDERNEANVGDMVRIVETRPISSLKRWRLVEIQKKEGKDIAKKREE
ncbi:30S ribosomal protein S17 [Verrucomicrobiota bacterium]